MYDMNPVKVLIDRSTIKKVEPYVCYTVKLNVPGKYGRARLMKYFRGFTTEGDEERTIYFEDFINEVPEFVTNFINEHKDHVKFDITVQNRETSTKELKYNEKYEYELQNDTKFICPKCKAVSRYDQLIYLLVHYNSDKGMGTCPVCKIHDFIFDVEYMSDKEIEQYLSSLEQTSPVLEQNL